MKATEEVVRRVTKWCKDWEAYLAFYSKSAAHKEPQRVEQLMEELDKKYIIKYKE